MNEYVLVKNSKTISPQNQISISTWVQLERFAFTINPIITKGYISKYYTLWLTKNGGKLLLNWNTPNKFFSDDDEIIKANEWIYLTVTYDGISVKYFINGVKTFEKSFDKKINNSNENLYIGSSYPGGDEYFTGLIDELRIYNRALSEK